MLTPGGYRHKSLVHRVEPGHAFIRKDGKLWSRDLSSGAELEIPEIGARKGIATANRAWITYADWNKTSAEPISLFSTDWVVPPAPETHSEQRVFIFNSLLSEARDEIVQPVLQWGVTDPGGGDYWAVASWHVDPNGNAFYSPSLVPVQEGQTLVGLITLTGQSGNSFSYQCEFQGIDGTALPISTISELTWATETLECYGIGQCSDYPNCSMTQMTSIDLRVAGSPAPLSWSVTNQVIDCGQRTAIVNTANPGGEIDIVYR